MLDICFLTSALKHCAVYAWRRAIDSVTIQTPGSKEEVVLSFPSPRMDSAQIKHRLASLAKPPGE